MEALSLMDPRRSVSSGSSANPPDFSGVAWGVADAASGFGLPGVIPFVELGVAAFCFAGPGDVCFASAPLAGLADCFGTGAGFFRLAARGRVGDLATRRVGDLETPVFFCCRESSARPVLFPCDPPFSLFSEVALIPLNV